MEKTKSTDSPTTKKNAPSAGILAQLLSPAMGLAILGTGALIFSFYRAGQLTNLVISKEDIKKIAADSLKNKTKIDINSQAVVRAANNSEGAIFVVSGNYKEAVRQAMQDLTDNPPDNLPSVLEAGDILSQFGDDKELGFGLLERAVSLAPNNQYIALRYAERLMSTGRTDEAEPKLFNLSQKYPEWLEPRIILTKVHFLQNKPALASTELVALSNEKKIDSIENEQISLMLAKLGRIPDAYTIFKRAALGEPQKCFYAKYCQDWIEQSPDSYQTVLAMVKSNLESNTNSANVAKQLNLEIKHAALLLLLGRPQDAESALQKAITAYPKSFDLHILLAASYVALEHLDKGKEAFINAVDIYQPKLQ